MRNCQLLIEHISQILTDACLEKTKETKTVLSIFDNAQVLFADEALRHAKLGKHLSTGYTRFATSYDKSLEEATNSLIKQYLLGIRCRKQRSTLLGRK